MRQALVARSSKGLGFAPQATVHTVRPGPVANNQVQYSPYTPMLSSIRRCLLTDESVLAQMAPLAATAGSPMPGEQQQCGSSGKCGPQRAADVPGRTAGAVAVQAQMQRQVQWPKQQCWQKDS